MNGREVRVDVAASADGGRTWGYTSRADTGWPTGADEATVRAWVEHAASDARAEMFRAAGLDLTPRALPVTLADSIAAALLAGLPGAEAWPPDADHAWVVVTDVDAWINVDTGLGGTAETVRSFAQRVEFGTLMAAVRVAAETKAAALRADGNPVGAALFEAWASELQTAGLAAERDRAAARYAPPEPSEPTP